MRLSTSTQSFVPAKKDYTKREEYYMKEKTKGKKELYTALITTGAFISYNVGAGFASGNELLQFFGAWNETGIITSIISGFILLLWICSVLYLIGKQSPAKAATENFTWIAGPIAGNFFRLCTDIMVFGCFMLMFSGSSNLLNQQFGLPNIVGAIILGVVTLAVVLGGLKAIENVLGYAGIAILCYVAVFVLVTLFGGKSSHDNLALIPTAVENGQILRANVFSYFPFSLMPSLADLNNPVLDGILYSAQMVIAGGPFFIMLGKRASTTKQTIHAAILSSVAYYFCITCVIVMIAFNFDAVVNPATGQMYAFPALAVVNKLWGAGGWTYSLLIFTGIFSTAIGYLWVMSDRVFPNQENTKKNKIFVTIMTLIGIFVGDKVPFSTLINVMFPLIGAVGVIMLIVCTVRLVQLNKSQEGEAVATEQE